MKKKKNLLSKGIFYMLVSIFLFFPKIIFGSDFAVITNSNFPELKESATQALFLLKSEKDSFKETLLFELNGSLEDSKTLLKLKSSAPKIVLAMGVYSATMARKVLPKTPIIYTFVRYPEVEGFSQDPRMIGILNYGSEHSLSKLISFFNNGKTEFASIKKIAVMYSEFLEPSVSSLIERLKQVGLDPHPYPLSEASLLELAMQDITTQYQAILLLPDKNTQNDYSLRFILSRCMEKRVLTFALDYFLVEKGVACGVYTKQEECLKLAVDVAKNFALTGKLPEKNLLAPSTTYIVINKAALTYMNVQLNFKPDLEIK